MKAIIEERKVVIALTRNIPPAADTVYKLWLEVLVNFEKDKKLIFPLILVDVTGRMTRIRSLEGTKRKTFKAIQIKQHYRSRNFNLQCSQKMSFRSPPVQIHLTEIIYPSDPLAWKFNYTIIK